MNFTNLFKIAVKALGNNKLRGFLTMLGIIIGVASVITMLAIGQGSKRSIQAEISEMGSNMIMIHPVQKLFNKVKAPAADADRKLAAAAAEAEQPTERVLIGEDETAAGDDDGQKSVSKPAQYYTYTPAETSEESCDE